MHVPGLLLLDTKHYRELCKVSNAMKLSSRLNQATGVDIPGSNPLYSMQEIELDVKGNQWIDARQETSTVSEDACKVVDSNLAPSNLDAQSMNALKGELCGLYTQASIGYVDIFEILREEILAAEARELEVDSLLNASEEFEESSSVEGEESTDVREPAVSAMNGDDFEADTQICSLHGRATDAGDEALIHSLLQKGEDERIKTPSNPSVGLLEDTTLREGEGMGAENYGAVQLKDKKAGLEDEPNSVKLREVGTAQDDLVVEDVGLTPPCTAQRGSIVHEHQSGQTDVGVAQDHLVGEDVGDTEPCVAQRGSVVHDHQSGHADKVGYVGLAQSHQVSGLVEPVESPSKGILAQAHQKGDQADHEESQSPLNRELNGETLSKKDKVASTELRNNTLLAKIRADDDDLSLLADITDQMSEHSDDEEYLTNPFSGPMAFSGMLSYSGLIPYSGQIPHSGNMSLHSESSTSTRSFAFPILASDWANSPAKIGQPDRRYLRRGRRWRPHFCCARPATLFD